MTRGRPRSAACDRAILEAALQEHAVNGFDGMSVDAVAARAGVSKATIYRRYPAKIDLVAEAIFTIGGERKAEPDTGSLRADLHSLCENLRELFADPVLGRNIRMVVADAARNPELARVHDEFVRTRRELSAAVFRRAIDRGELRADTDLQVAADTLVGPLFYRHLVSHMPIDDAYVEAVINGFVRAYGQGSDTSSTLSTPGIVS